MVKAVSLFICCMQCGGYWFNVLKRIDSLFVGFSYIIVVFVFLLVVYLGCIFLDQLRLQAWKLIAKCFFDKNGK